MKIRLPSLYLRKTVLSLAMVALALNLSAADKQVKVSFHFGVEDLSIRKVGDYDLVSLKGGTFPEDEAGTPLLPAVYVNVLVPAGSTVKGVSTTAKDEVLVNSGLNIYPVQKPTPLEEGRNPEFTPKKAEAYQKTSKKELSSSTNPQTTRGMTLVPVRLNPVRLVPATGDLYLATDIDVVVTVDKPAQKPTVKGGKHFADFADSVKKQAANPDEPDGMPKVEE